jgi:hypothetical protein
MARPISAVRASLARQRAIARVTRQEIIRHCQPPIPPARAGKPGKKGETK